MKHTNSNEVNRSGYYSIFFLALTLFLFIRCSEEKVFSSEKVMVAHDSGGKVLGRNDGVVSFPFKAEFFTDRVERPSSGSCIGEDPEFWSPNIQVGSGEATHLGKFNADGEFCGSTVPPFIYKNGLIVFTATNGDELHTAISGEVLPSEHPDFTFEFFDPFEFVGGTGRFEGATGSGVTESYVDCSSIPGCRTYHTWTGELILQKGNN